MECSSDNIQTLVRSGHRLAVRCLNIKLNSLLKCLILAPQMIRVILPKTSERLSSQTFIIVTTVLSHLHFAYLFYLIFIYYLLTFSWYIEEIRRLQLTRSPECKWRLRLHRSEKVQVHYLSCRTRPSLSRLNADIRFMNTMSSFLSLRSQISFPP